MSDLNLQAELEIAKAGFIFDTCSNKQLAIKVEDDRWLYYFPKSGKYRWQGERDWCIAENTNNLISIVKSRLETEQKLNQLQKEQEEETLKLRKERAIKLIIDFRDTLPKYGLKLQCVGGGWLFELDEKNTYYIDFFNKEYYPNGYGANQKGGYKFTDCLGLLETIKLFHWEFKGVEVLPEIDIINLLKTDKAKNMQNSRKFNNT